MATVTGITAAKAQEIFDDTVASVAIVGSSLVFTKHDGSTFDAGDFEDFIHDQVTAETDGMQATIDGIPAVVTAAVNSAVPPAVAGGLSAKGNISGNVTFPGLTAAQMVNRMFTATLTGNITINSTNFPSPPIAGTQFAMVLKQDATGGRTLTLTNIKRSQGVLDLSTGGNSVDIVVFMYDGTSWYAGLMGMGFV